ncbi:MAG: SURF1 family protein [Oceanospirillaceae bacterium]|nr:SURF1 family protein [Oceanospirillaceae bacterium]
MSKTQNIATRKLIFICLALVMVLVMLRLGFWQLERAEEKQQLLAQWQQPVAEISFPLPLDRLYQKVKVEGVFDLKRYFLLDNRTRAGRVGYEVLALLTLEKNSVLLVNLGWLAGSVDREFFPQLKLPTGKVVLSGWLKKVEKSFQLAADDWRSSWPKRVQQIELSRIAKTSNIEHLEHVVLLSEYPVVPELITQWKPVTMSVAKHLGYAVQWFLMALVLCAMLVWFYTKERHRCRGNAYE